MATRSESCMVSLKARAYDLAVEAQDAQARVQQILKELQEVDEQIKAKAAKQGESDGSAGGGDECPCARCRA